MTLKRSLVGAWLPALSLLALACSTSSNVESMQQGDHADMAGGSSEAGREASAGAGGVGVDLLDASTQLDVASDAALGTFDTGLDSPQQSASNDASLDRSSASDMVADVGDSALSAIDVSVPVSDAMVPEAGDVTVPEAGDALACSPVAGLGQLTCVCNSLGDDVWQGASPLLLQTHLDLGIGGWDASKLTSGAQQIIAAGGLTSEAAAYEVLNRCETATLLKTANLIVYGQADAGKETDFLASIDGRKVGVTVVRAVVFPYSNPYTVTMAENILTAKLNDSKLSQARVVGSADAWNRSVLVVVAYGQEHANAITTAWNGLDTNLRGDTIVIVVVTDGDDSLLY